jgi:hypothetical protein
MVQYGLERIIAAPDALFCGRVRVPSGSVSASASAKLIAQTGFAPGTPHLANLPLASLQRAAFAGALGGHFVKWPFASRQGAAKDGVDNMATATAAAKAIRMVSLPRLIDGRMPTLCDQRKRDSQSNNVRTNPPAITMDNTATSMSNSLGRRMMFILRSLILIPRWWHRQGIALAPYTLPNRRNLVLYFHVYKHPAGSGDACPTRSGVSYANVASIMVAVGWLVFVANDLPELIEGAAVVTFALAIQERQHETHREGGFDWAVVALVNDLIERANGLEDEMIAAESHPAILEWKENIAQAPSGRTGANDPVHFYLIALGFLKKGLRFENLERNDRWWSSSSRLRILEQAGRKDLCWRACATEYRIRNVFGGRRYRNTWSVQPALVKATAC